MTEKTNKQKFIAWINHPRNSEWETIKKLYLEIIGIDDDKAFPTKMSIDGNNFNVTELINGVFVSSLAQNISPFLVAYDGKITYISLYYRVLNPVAFDKNSNCNMYSYPQLILTLDSNNEWCIPQEAERGGNRKSPTNLIFDRDLETMREGMKNK